MADSLTLQGQDLVCRRGEREVFSGLHFTLSSGRMLAVTGRNGAGKSSLLRMNAGLLRIEAGTTSVDLVGTMFCASSCSAESSSALGTTR